MELDNGENIKLNKKKNNSFKVWDTVNYEENGEWKWKEVKEDAPKKPQWNQESQNRGAMVGMCIKLAFEKLYQWEDDFQKESRQQVRAPYRGKDQKRSYPAKQRDPKDPFQGRVSGRGYRLCVLPGHQILWEDRLQADHLPIYHIQVRTSQRTWHLQSYQETYLTIGAKIRTFCATDVSPPFPVIQ